MPDPDLHAWLVQARAHLALSVGREPGDVRVLVAYAKTGHGMEWLLPIDDAGRPTERVATPHGSLPIVDSRDLVTLTDLDEVDLAIMRACAVPMRAKEIARKCRLSANAELRRRLSRLKNRLGMLGREAGGYALTPRGRKLLQIA